MTTSDTPRVREASIDDADAIASVHVASWQATYRGLVPDSVLDRMSVRERADRWRDWFSQPQVGGVFVAEADGAVVGFVNAGASRDGDASGNTGEIRAIYAVAEAWGTGAGAALMNEAVAWLRNDYTCATLWVLEGNARGRGFYDKGGWAPDGSRQMLDFDGTELPEIRYRIEF